MPECEKDTRRLVDGAIAAAQTLSRNLINIPKPVTSSETGDNRDISKISKNMRAYTDRYNQVETAILIADTLMHTVSTVLALSHETQIAHPPISAKNYHPRRSGFDY